MYSDWKGRIVQFLEKNVVLNDYFEYVAPAVKLLTKDMHTLEAFVCAVPYHKDYTRTFTLSPFATHENLLIRLLKISNGEGNNNSNDAAAAAAADGGGCDGGCVNTNAQAVKDVAALFKVCSPAAAAESYKPHYERGQIDVYGPGVGEQVDACVKALDAATARELQRINEIKMLNTAFLSDIRKLHSNTDTNSTHTIRCTKITTADKPCNGKIVLEYVQHTEETDATIGACIKENRRRYNDLLAPLKIPQEVFTWMFRVERVCRTICEEATRCTPEARARLAATAKSVFQKVLGVAAMHKVLWLVNYNFLAFLPSVTTVLASSPTDAQALVDYVLANRRYVPTVAKHFKPYNSVPIFPSVLTLVLSVYDGDTLTPLLGSCNISAVQAPHFSHSRIVCFI